MADQSPASIAAAGRVAQHLAAIAFPDRRVQWMRAAGLSDRASAALAAVGVVTVADLLRAQRDGLDVLRSSVRALPGVGPKVVSEIAAWLGLAGT